MLDHIGILVGDLARSRGFYECALKPLGYAVTMELTAAETPIPAVAFGESAKPEFWITGGVARTQPPIHLAFRAHDRASVDAFHAAAIAAGGRDNGPPGLRLHYHAHYYAAFVRDPDGHNIEAVCHAAV